MSAATTRYNIKDLGTLSGGTASRVGDVPLVGATLNKNGQAAGASLGGPTTAVLFNNGTVTNLNTLQAGISSGFGVNDAGQVVGEETSLSDPCSCFHAFLYSSGAMHVIDSPSVFPDGAQAYAINNLGEVVGAGFLSSSVFHAFVYSGGKVTDIGGGFQAHAIALNDAGQVIGNGTAVGAFLYSGGKMTSLPVPSGANAVSAMAISSNGHIAGALSFSSGSHLAVFKNGAWTDLGAQPMVAFGINSNDQIVGVEFFPNQYKPFRPGKHVGMIFSNGSAVSLNTLIPAGSGYTITDAVGINDAGQILCDATTPSGAEHAVILTPS